MRENFVCGGSDPVDTFVSSCRYIWLLEGSWGLRGTISSIGAACGNKLCHILPGRENIENKTMMKTCFDIFQEGRKEGRRVKLLGEEITDMDLYG